MLAHSPRQPEHRFRGRHLLNIKVLRCDQKSSKVETARYPGHRPRRRTHEAEGEGAHATTWHHTAHSLQHAGEQQDGPYDSGRSDEQLTPW